MLKGEYTFIRAQRNKGIGKTSNKEYDFALLTVSDGLESFEMSIKPELVGSLEHLTKGDKIAVEVSVTSGQRGTQYQVEKVQVLQTK